MKNNKAEVAILCSLITAVLALVFIVLFVAVFNQGGNV